MEKMSSEMNLQLLHVITIITRAIEYTSIINSEKGRNNNSRMISELTFQKEKLIIKQ